MKATQFGLLKWKSLSLSKTEEDYNQCNVSSSTECSLQHVGEPPKHVSSRMIQDHPCAKPNEYDMSTFDAIFYYTSFRCLVFTHYVLQT